MFYDFEHKCLGRYPVKGREMERSCCSERAFAHCGVHAAGDKVQNARTASHYTRIVHSHSQSPPAFQRPLDARDAAKAYKHSLCVFCSMYLLCDEGKRQSRAHGSGAECSVTNKTARWVSCYKHFTLDDTQKISRKKFWTIWTWNFSQTFYPSNSISSCEIMK